MLFKKKCITRDFCVQNRKQRATKYTFSCVSRLTIATYSNRKVRSTYSSWEWSAHNALHSWLLLHCITFYSIAPMLPMSWSEISCGRWWLNWSYWWQPSVSFYFLLNMSELPQLAAYNRSVSEINSVLT